MPKYQVQIEASNFLVEMEGRTAKHGFITFKYIEADDPTSAENMAVQMIRDDQQLRDLVQNGSDDPPVMDVTQIAELESFPDQENQPGRIWYAMHPKRWWQFWK